MSKFILLLSFVSLASTSISQQNEIAQSRRKIEKYKTIKVGKKKWMKNNLNVVFFRNGDTIPEAKTNEEWLNAQKERKPAWCYYENDPQNGEKLGRLYNWYAVTDKRGLAPRGFRIANKKDWDILIRKMGGVDTTKEGINRGAFRFNSKDSVNLKSFFGNVATGDRYGFWGDLTKSTFDNTSNFLVKWEEEYYSTWWIGCEPKYACMQRYYTFAHASNLLDILYDCSAGEGHAVRCVKGKSKRSKGFKIVDF